MTKRKVRCCSCLKKFVPGKLTLVIEEGVGEPLPDEDGYPLYDMTDEVFSGPICDFCVNLLIDRNNASDLTR